MSTFSRSVPRSFSSTRWVLPQSTAARLAGKRQPATRPRRRPRAPGRCSGPWPCQSVTSRSSSATWPASRSVAGQPASSAARRSTRVRTAVGQAGQDVDVEPVAGRRRRGVRRRGPAVERVGVGPQQGGGAGQRGGDARAEVALQAGQDVAAHPGPGERRVGVVRVVPGGVAGGGGPDDVARRGRAAGAGSGRGPAAIPASERAPEPRASPSSTVSAWSSRVWPSSTAAAPSRSAASSRAR